MIVNNKAKSITISSSNSGQRLDNFLISQIKNVPKSHVYKLIRTGQVRINSSRSKPSTKLNIDDVVRIPPYKANENIKPKISKELINKTFLNIIYEDEDIMVFNKPSAVAVHSGTNIGYGLIDIIRLVKTECERIDLLHRLDKDTSGCIIITKKLSSLRFFQTQLKDNILQKKYICLVDGLWDNALKRDEINLLRNSKSSKSITEFKVLKKYKNSTLLEVKIVTGRYHQIRKHCSLLGHAIIGDIRYGNKDINRLYKKNGLSRIFLHSSSISFIERNSEKLKKIECSLPIELMKYLENHK
jgi:23S rRNA pseudouridine955/2504/2580 synthase